MTTKPTLQEVDPTTTETTTGEPLDPFAPENLRLSQSFNEMVAVKKILTTVPVRKPGQQDFVRVRAGPEFRENFPIIDLKDDREEFIVTTALVPELITELVHKTLFLAINKQARFSSGRYDYRVRTARILIGGAQDVRQPIWPHASGFVSEQI
jgi:hypothetical protein